MVHRRIFGSKQCYKLYLNQSINQSNAVICLKNRLLLYLGINKVKKLYQD